MAFSDVVVLWRERDWWCQLQPRAGGVSQLNIYKGDKLVTAESAPTGEAARLRADILRRRLLRGDLQEN
jgi:hypothetical protein